MTKAKKQVLTQEELLEQALVPENEQPYMVPENWVWTRLGVITQINPPKMINEPIPETVSFVPMASVSEISGSITDMLEKAFGEVSKGYTPFIENDVLFAKITPCMENGKVAMAQNLINGIGFGSTEFYVFRPYRCCSVTLLYHLLRAQWFRDEAKENMAGAVGQQRVKKEFLIDYKIPLPPLAEQRRIGERIESLFEKLDRAKELAQNALDSFETRKAAILHKAFTGELTAHWREQNGVGMESWENTNIGCLFEVFSGKGFKEKEYTEKGVKLLRITNVNYDQLLWDDVKYLPKEYLESEKDLVLIPGDIVLALNRPITNGKVKVSAIDEEGPYILYQRVGCLRKKIDDIFVFFLYYMHSRFFKQQLEDNLQGSDQPYINLPPLKAIACPRPSLPEQQEIVRILDGLLEKEQRARELCDVIDKIDLMKKAILGRAFRGELGTNDPNEESAMGLLREVLK